MAPAAGHRCGTPLRRPVAENRRATLRLGTASLTQTARAPRGRHDRAVGEGAR
ncbi:DUF6380 family protein [Streptomyces sp. NPDC006624]|uniref:DUF6380 family protein n=1 Tax=Streptomyces sp. NPDC006624 TaxID=3154892 RepID=UPI0033A60CC4